MATATKKNKRIPASKLKALANDPKAAAKAVHLVYVNDSQEGYARQKNGKGFRYVYRNKLLRDATAINRIKSLVIPPAWEDVWICTRENGHLQATGKDTLSRKQYKYHQLWTELRNQTKFYRMLAFGNALKNIRKKIKKDLALPGLPKEKILALIIKLMENTGIRIGNEVYEKLYGSFGLTTLKDKHVDIKRNKLMFTFKGKKGIEHSISLQNKRLAKLVKQCQDIPGKELFQYYDEEGQRHGIDSGMINEYLKEITGEDFTAKDFRTWTGTVQALSALKEMGGFENEKEAKKNILAALDKVSEQLGNTRTVCKKYYVHPTLVEMYESSKLDPWFTGNGASAGSGNSGLSTDEQLLMKILKTA